MDPSGLFSRRFAFADQIFGWVRTKSLYKKMLKKILNYLRSIWYETEVNLTYLNIFEKKKVIRISLCN